MDRINVHNTQDQYPQALKFTTKALVGLPVILSIIGVILEWLSYHQGTYLQTTAIAFLIVLAIHLMLITPKGQSIYSLVIGLVMMQTIGGLFTSMHWPFGAVLNIIGGLGVFIAGVILIWSGVKASSALVIGLGSLLLLQLVIVVVNTELVTFARVLNYPILIVGVSVLMVHQARSIGERNLILFFIVEVIMFIGYHLKG